MRSLWSMLWRSLALLVAWGALLAPALALLDARLRRADPRWARLAVELLALASIAGASWAMARLVERRPFSSLGFAGPGAARAALAGVLLGTGWLAIALGPLAALGFLRFGPSGVLAWGGLASAAAALALNAATQELLFHGYLFQAVRREGGAAAAVLATSVLFVAAHLPAFQGAWLPALNTFLAGAAFGLSCAATGNLWLPIAMHATWNVLLGPVAGLAVSGRSLGTAGWRMLELRGPALATGGAFGPEGGLPMTLATAALAVGMWMALRDRAAASEGRAAGTG